MDTGVSLSCINEEVYPAAPMWPQPSRKENERGRERVCVYCVFV